MPEQLCEVSTCGYRCPVQAAVVVLVGVRTEPVGGRSAALGKRRVALCRFHAERHGLGSLAGVTP